MDATLTFTRTSLRPKPGTLTSRTSAPGAASGLTTANMVASFVVPAIVATKQLDAKIHENTKHTILAPACAAQGTPDSAPVSNPSGATYSMRTARDPLIAQRRAGRLN